jgi:2-keto-3-deoxy-L-rhamnonate aldolase RhmA
VTACRAHGKSAGILVRDADALAPALDQGFTFVGVGSEASWVAGGARAAVARSRATIA